MQRKWWPDRLKRFCLYLMSCMVMSCTSQRKSMPVSPSDSVKTDSLLVRLLGGDPESFGHILNNRDSFRVQIIYTVINRSRRNKAVFKNYYFNVSDEQYFYPASTVKLPVALLSLEWLNEMNKVQVSRNTTMITGKASSEQTEVFNDPSSEDGRPTIQHYIKKIFLVSDNDAFNRLYELLGADYITKKLHGKGYTGTEIVHRLSLPLSYQQNRETNPVTFYDTSMQPVFSKPFMISGQHKSGRRIYLGKGFNQNGYLVNEPFDFSAKNKMRLVDLHMMIQRVMFPENFRKSRRFNISNEDYRFIWQWMSAYPSESTFPQYDLSAFPDGYVKFLYSGSGMETLPQHMRIFNKAGSAYGFVTDAAYFADFEKNIEFILSATIYCNKDGIFNDDKYEYDSIGFPFLRQLGKAVYNYEVSRKRKYSPDLDKYRFKYKY